MRRALFALLLAGSLIATPALAAGRPPIYLDIGRNFTTGAEFYFRTVGAWLQSLLAAVGLKGRVAAVGEGTTCEASTPCGGGLVCQNVCDTAGCPRYEKRCVKGSNRVTVFGEFSSCGGKDLCVEGTFCTRVCPAGMDCGGSDYRCLKPVVPTGHCDVDTECLSVCGQLPFAPIGSSAFAASCVQGACLCAPQLTRLDAPRVACPEGQTGVLSCPTGSHAACTPASCAAGGCPPLLTCLTAPAYGGECMNDVECGGAECPQGAEPFCGDDRRCKCRVKQELTVSCQTAAECGSSVCASDEVAACVNGACACAPAGVVSACKTAADCSSNCPQGYTPACDNNACVCQKTTIVPVACQQVEECGSISCPEGYDKACKDAICVCAKQIQQP